MSYKTKNKAIQILNEVIHHVDNHSILQVSQKPLKTIAKKSYTSSSLTIPNNAQYIFPILKQYLPNNGIILEIGSGNGPHLEYFGKCLFGTKDSNVNNCENDSKFQWQPSDYKSDRFQIIHDRIASNNLSHFCRQPILLDLLDVNGWENNENLKGIFNDIHLVFLCNVIHICPWKCTLNLFHGLKKLFANQSGSDSTVKRLVMYGAYIVDGKGTESTFEFNENLQSRNKEWGVRELRDVEKAAIQNSMQLESVIDVPSENKVVIFRTK